MPTGRVAAYPAAPALENPVEGGGWLRTEIDIRDCLLRKCFKINLFLYYN